MKTLKIWMGFMGLVMGSLMMMSPAHAGSWIFLSGMGGKCLDAEGGIRKGARILGYACHGGTNQVFNYSNDGTIKMGGFCVDASGGLGRDGDGLVLWDCNGQANQRWAYNSSNNSMTGMNGKCVDLEGGTGHWFGNQRAILWSCNGQSNQKWYFSKLMSASQVSGAKLVNPGDKVTIRPPSGIIAAGGGNLTVTQQPNIIAGGAGNMVAAGGGNIIAAGGGNVIVPAGIIAAGAGN